MSFGISRDLSETLEKLPMPVKAFLEKQSHLVYFRPTRLSLHAYTNNSLFSTEKLKSYMQLEEHNLSRNSSM